MSKLTALQPTIESMKTAKIVPSEAIPFHDAAMKLKSVVAEENLFNYQFILSGCSLDPDTALAKYCDMHEDFCHKHAYTGFALKQLARHIKPDGVNGFGTYLTVCPPQLRAINYNYWRSRKCVDYPSYMGRSLIFRTRSAPGLVVVKGVVTPAYSPLDDVTILDELAKSIPDGGLMTMARGDVRSRFNLFWNDKVTDGNYGTLMSSVHMSNSEVGAGSFRMEPMVYFSAYDAAFISAEEGTDVVIRHVGETRVKLYSAVNKVLDADGPFIQAFECAMTDRLTSIGKTPEEIFEALGTVFKFSDTKILRITNIYQEGQNNSLGGLAIAVAKAANSENADSGEEMQQVAGKLITGGWSTLGFKRMVDI